MKPKIFIRKMSALKNKIKLFIKNNDLNPSSFCKNSNLSPAAIHNILNADTPNPTIETVLEISKIMNCSIDDLFDQNFPTQEKMVVDNPELLKSVCISICADKEIEGKSFGEFATTVKNVYKYCKENDLKSADKNFVKWYIRNKHSIHI